MNIGDEEIISDKTLHLDFKAGNFPVDSVVSLISNGGVLLKETIANTYYTFSKDFLVEKDAYFRIEIRNPAGKMLALTNPIYLKNKQ